jgi:hypothetical protein
MPGPRAGHPRMASVESILERESDVRTGVGFSNHRSEHGQPFQVWLNGNQQIKIGLADALGSTNPPRSIKDVSDQLAYLTSKNKRDSSAFSQGFTFLFRRLRHSLFCVVALTYRIAITTLFTKYRKSELSWARLLKLRVFKMNSLYFGGDLHKPDSSTKKGSPEQGPYSRSLVVAKHFEE